MKRIKNVFDKIISIENCKLAIISASYRKGKRKYVKYILNNIDEYAQKLSELLAQNNFVSPYREKRITEGLSRKERIIEIPRFFPDQCAHHAIMNILESYIKNSSYYYSCANIESRGGKQAYKAMIKATIKHAKSSKYCFKFDIHHFYPSIKHSKLKKFLLTKIKDSRLLRALYTLIDSNKKGLPIGNFTSPWLAEWFLQSMDNLIKQVCKIKIYVRYADDGVLIDSNKRKLRQARDKIQKKLKELGLEMKSDYQLFQIQKDKKYTEGIRKGRCIDFVGYQFGRGFTIIRKRRSLAFIRQSKRIQKLQQEEKFISFKLASGFISRSACIKHGKTKHLKEKYYDTVDIQFLKQVVRLYSQKKIKGLKYKIGELKMNKVLLSGRLVADPIKYEKLTHVKIGIKKPNSKDSAGVVDVTFYGKLKELVDNYLSKGRLVAITGHLDFKAVKQEDGSYVNYYDVIGEEIDFLDSPKNKETF